ncbi:hypothetical protein [Hyphococcus sp.]|uniref:hypothetical protein n=1 Tax=Hyphococcus sp. TaxID=2038636 RepID=UPI003CCBDE84
MKRAADISRNKLTAALAAGLLAFCAPSVAASQSLKESRAQNAEERALSREASFTQSVCGMDFDIVIDWRSAADWPDGASIADSCDGALGALEAVCRRGDAPQITRFVCAGDGSGASLRGGTLRYGASPGDNGFSETMSALGG